MTKKTIFVVFSLILSFSAYNQNNVSGNDQPLYIDILVSPNKTVSINNHVNILPDYIKKHVSGILNNHSIMENENLVYRIYGTRSMKLGDIMDVQQKLYTLYPAKYERYLILDKNEEILTDDANWTKKLKQLEILKIDKPLQ
ncbi:hypothetical protein [Galbibacter sp.]|uniref:hypothetical protein n=1 Tax=Galbibacter sp. TaxID=2918471 RepID=UPI003A95174E